MVFFKPDGNTECNIKSGKNCRKSPFSPAGSRFTSRVGVSIASFGRAMQLCRMHLGASVAADLGFG